MLDLSVLEEILINFEVVVFHVLFAITNSLFIIGLKAAFDEENILNPLKEGFTAFLEMFGVDNEWIVYFKKPIFSCVYCMASFWGVVFVLIHSEMILFELNFTNIFTYVIVLCGFNFIISKKIDSLVMIKNH